MESQKAAQNVLLFFGIAWAILTIKFLILYPGNISYGRLIVPPPYDDVSYFIDALGRVRTFQQQGLIATLQQFWTNAPHAPYSTIAAFLGFLLAGPNPVAAYYMNVLAAAGVIAGLSAAFRWPAWYVAIVALFLVSLPWFDRLLTVFHPDLISGFGVAATCITLIWQDRILTTNTRLVAGGIGVALVLLIKPTAFPVMLALTGAAFALGAVISRINEGSWTPAINRLVIGATCVGIIAGPYYVKEFKAVRDYIMAALVVEKDVWTYAGNDHLTYYFKRARETQFWWPVISPVLSILLVGTLTIAGKRTEALRVVFLLVLTFCAYAISTINDVKTYYFGSPFYGLLALAVPVAVWLFSREAVTAPKTARLVLVAPVALAAAAFYQFGDGQEHFDVRTSLQARTIYDRVFALIQDRSNALKVAGTPRQIHIYAPLPVTVATHAFLFRAMQNNIDADVSYAPHETSAAALQESAMKADLILLPSAPIVEKSQPPFPVKPLLPDFSEWMQHNDRFKLVDDIPFDDGTVAVFSSVERGPP